MNQDLLIELDRKLKVFLEHGGFVGRVLVKSNLSDSENVVTVQELRDHGHDFAGKLDVFGLLGVDAQPGEVSDSKLCRPSGFDFGELTEVIPKAIDGATIKASPKCGFAHRHTAHAGEGLVVVGGPGDHVNVWIDVVHVFLQVGGSGPKCGAPVFVVGVRKKQLDLCGPVGRVRKDNFEGLGDSLHPLVVGGIGILAVDSVKRCGDIEDSGSYFQKLAIEDGVVAHSFPPGLQLAYNILQVTNCERDGYRLMSVKAIKWSWGWCGRILPAILATICCSGLVLAHEFERGEIERSFEVIVRGQQVSVNWRVGLSPATMADMLLDSQAIDAREHAQLLAKIDPDSPKETQADKSLPSEEQQPPKTRVSKPTSSPASQTLQDKDVLAIENRLLDKLEKHVAGGWSSKISLKVDGKPLKFSAVTVARSSRHHVNFEIQCKALLESTGKHNMVVCDSNLLDTRENEGSGEKSFRYNGGIRTAFRAKGDAVLINSTAPAVLARSKVKETRGLDLEHRMELSTISADIVLMDQSKNVNQSRMPSVVK